MKLYHFTRAIHLPNINERGLVPSAGEGRNSLLTFGIPVVWFTANPNPEWLIKFHADAVRLTVDVEENELTHWLTWFEHTESDMTAPNGIERHIAGREIIASIRSDPECSERFMRDAPNHYVHFGVVHRKRIKLVQPIEQATDAESVEWLAKHSQKRRAILQRAWGASK
jgi:hypothetical protein